MPTRRAFNLWHYHLIVIGVILENCLALYDATASTAVPPIQLKILAASDTLPGDRFGTDIAISAEKVIVGAPQHQHLGSGTGAAYVFDVRTGDQLFKLTAPDAKENDLFGISVAIKDNLALVGALRGSGDHSPSAGAAYLFDLSTGLAIRKFTALDGEQFDRFGSAVAMQSDVVLIGAPNDDDNGTNAGAAYVFDIESGQQLRKLTPLDSAVGDNFGAFSIGLSGDKAVVGAWLDDDLGPQSGSAYTFDVSTGRQLSKLLPSDGRGGDFGAAVDLNGNEALVGTFLQNSGAGTFSGSAYLFDAESGLQVHKLIASDSAALDQFGQSVALGEKLAIVGAPYKDGTQGIDAGAIYLFDRETGLEVFKITPTDLNERDLFGASIAVDYGTIVVGARHQDDGTATGKVYVVFLVPEPTSFALLLIPIVGALGKRWQG
jgi:hypothetical protein